MLKLRLCILLLIAGLCLAGCEVDEETDPVPGSPGQPVPQPQVDHAPRSLGPSFA